MKTSSAVSAPHAHPRAARACALALTALVGLGGCGPTTLAARPRWTPYDVPGVTPEADAESDGASAASDADTDTDADTDADTDTEAADIAPSTVTPRGALVHVRRAWLPGTYYDRQFIWNEVTEDVCPAPSYDRYVLLYDAESGEIGPLDDTIPARADQQIVVCVINPDYRDRYSVTVSSPAIETTPATSPIEFQVGDTTTRATITSSGRVELHEAPITLTVDAAAGEESGAAGRALVDALAATHSRRAALLAILERAFSEPMTRDRVEQLRDTINDIIFPAQAGPPGDGDGDDAHAGADAAPGTAAGTARSPTPAATWSPACPALPASVAAWMDAGHRGNEAHLDGSHARAAGREATPRCYLPLDITYNQLPDGISYVDGRIIVEQQFLARVRSGARAPAAAADADPDAADDADDAAAAPGATAFDRYVDRLSSALDWLVTTESFTQRMLEDLHTPAHVFNVGRFDGNREVNLTFVRSRRTLEVHDAEVVTLASDTTETRYRVRVHATTYFRVEPGIALSTLRRPTFGIQTNDIGDRVIAIADEGRQAVAPVIFASYYWCGVDLRLPPFRRRCSGDPSRAWTRIVPHLPALAIGMPLDFGLFNGGSSPSGSVYIGASVDWIPYVSLTMGANIAYGVPMLRSGYTVGDPVRAGIDSVDAITRTGTAAVPFIAFSISGDVFASMRNFSPTQ